MKFCMTLGVNFAIFVATFGCTFVEQRMISNATVSLEDYLSKHYDKSMRPDCDKQTDIKVGVHVISFGRIEEANMEFSVFMYFRQTWKDRRLANLVNTTTVLSRSHISALWFPDTFCSNAKQSDLMTPDSEVHSAITLYPDGEIFYSRGAHIVASCHMNLRNFPMDTQHCELRFESYGYTDADIKLSWINKTTTVANSEMAQFSVDGVALSEQRTFYVTGNFTILKATFIMNRRVGYYIIQTYIPCTFLVMLSWIVFWMGTEETGNRLTVGITTILTIVFLLGYTNASLPKVSYVKGMDMYLMVSFLFIFLSLIECIIVDKFYKLQTNRTAKQTSKKWEDKETQVKTCMDNFVSANIIKQRKTNRSTQTKEENQFELTSTSNGKNQPENPCQSEIESWVDIHPEKKSLNIFRALRWSTCADVSMAIRVDRASRILFPLSFVMYNVAYWFTYLNRIDILPSGKQ